jgi:outer membrane lipoprotein SlyB
VRHAEGAPRWPHSIERLDVACLAPRPAVSANADMTAAVRPTRWRARCRWPTPRGAADNHGIEAVLQAARTQGARIMLNRPISTVVSVAALALVAACAVPVQQDRVVYEATPVRQAPVSADYGRVEYIGTVDVASRPSGAGAILGGIVGAVIGHQIGSGVGNGLATGAGVVGGALAGNAIEARSRRPDEVYRVQVRFDNGSVRDFDFMRIDDLRVGDRVKLESGQLHRL